jgi:hypothetical protein
MRTGFKLSHRLARGFWVVVSAAALAGCAGESLTNPGNPSNPVSTIIVSPVSANVTVTETLQLSVVLHDANGGSLSGRTVSWSTNDGSIATVTASGLVAGTDTGTATITASSEGKVASATVRVRKKGSVDTLPPPPPPPSTHAGYFVSPSGSSSGDGSQARPWDLPTALANASSKVQPGDTVWLRGGTYRGTFRSSSKLKGTASAWVVVRQYPGERAILDANGGTVSALYVGGEYSVFWGFEFTNSDPNRVLSLTERRTNVIANYANHTKYINLIIHDGGVAFYNESPYYDVEMVGCVIYNNGYQQPDRGHGHAIYLRSNTGPVIARDNIMFNQFGYGVHIFTNPGEGQLNNIRLEGNVSFNNGTLATNSASANILFGGDDYSTGGVMTSNYTYNSPGVAGYNVKVGYGATQNGTIELTGNYFAGGATVIDFGYWSSLTATSNTFMGTGQVIHLSDPALAMSKFAGQTQASLPTSTKVVVRKVLPEVGRANVVVYNWGGDASVSVGLSGIVPTGASYEIRNVQDLFGAPVVSGTYGGGSVTLPIRAVQPPVPVGFSSSRSPSTGTVFSAYVVTIRQ